jgi:YVTN family beta-propeller protein
MNKERKGKMLLWLLALGALLVASLVAVPAEAQMMNPSSIPLGRPVTFDAVYVVNGGDGMTSSISVINAENNTLAGTIQLTNAMWPHHVYLSADRRTLAVAVPGMDMSMGHNMGPQTMQGAVMVLDARTGATINSTMVPMMNHNAIYSPNQTEIWTSQMMGGSVLVLDATTLATKQTINVGGMPAEVTFSPNSRRAFVANTMSNDVSVINIATKTVSTAIPVGVTPVVPSPKGRTALSMSMTKPASKSA